jgi:hypothetical protein
MQKVIFPLLNFYSYMRVDSSKENNLVRVYASFSSSSSSSLLFFLLPLFFFFSSSSSSSSSFFFSVFRD